VTRFGVAIPIYYTRVNIEHFEKSKKKLNTSNLITYYKVERGFNKRTFYNEELGLKFFKISNTFSCLGMHNFVIDCNNSILSYARHHPHSLLPTRLE